VVRRIVLTLLLSFVALAAGAGPDVALASVGL
jgi:hypothetical protein